MPHAEQERREVKRGRKETRRRAGGPAVVGIDEPERAVTAKCISEIGSLAEVQKIRTAAHGDMLAGINEATRDRVLERCHTPASLPTCLEQGQFNTGIDECRR
jgi:hypothetical protein